MKKIAFTLCSNNYLASATLLIDSFMAKNPDFVFYIGLVDKVHPSIKYPVSEKIVVLPCENILPVEQLRQMSSIYKIIELNTSLKPFYINFFFSQNEDCKVIYLDPDIYVYSSFTEIVNLLDQYDFLITPHCLTPIPLDNKFPSERSFMKYGIYNLGFIALRKCHESIFFVKWWMDRLSRFCYMETELGLYVDQSWVEFLPVFFDKVYISKNPGWNSAFWNLHERFYEMGQDCIMVNKNFPLVFFHFSSFDLNNVSSLAKGQNRYTISSRQDVKCIFEEYSKMLTVAKGYYQSDIPCAYTKRSFFDKLRYYWNRYNIRRKLSI